MEAVRKMAAPNRFPRHILQDAQTGLVLFAAAWYGKQDAIWMAEAGMTATCVDVDIDRLLKMAGAYPQDWEYRNDDVFEFAATSERKWDVVTVDCPTNLFERCAGWAKVWCNLATEAVILGTGPSPSLNLPDGWHVTETLERSTFAGGVFWTVLEP